MSPSGEGNDPACCELPAVALSVGPGPSCLPQSTCLHVQWGTWTLLLAASYPPLRRVGDLAPPACHFLPAVASSGEPGPSCLSQATPRRVQWGTWPLLLAASYPPSLRVGVLAPPVFRELPAFASSG